MLRSSSLLALALCASAVHAAPELILPQNRNAFYADETIELAVAGLGAGPRATVQVAPSEPTLGALTLSFGSDRPTLALPPNSLAPGKYTLKLDGARAAELTVVSGINRSTLLLTSLRYAQALAGTGANFLVGNAFQFGLLDQNGMPSTQLRGRRSPGMQPFERAVALDLPTLVYMYLTGYVTHKPWGTKKSWAEPHMTEAIRLLSFHVAQRLRRYARNIVSVGTLDEPGLSHGPTPSGREFSGFPNWDERAWYEARNWELTDDPGARSDDDWMKYLSIRSAIMKEQNGQAKRDLQQVWPQARFSSDFYAPHAIMDGTDPLNQEINDIPCSHVFLDWGMGKLGVIGALYLEKSHDPLAKVAHALNGQLVGAPVPSPQLRDANRLVLNGLLAAGIRSNWWLNEGGLSAADVLAIDEPALRLGPLFLQMSPAEHDVAVLFSTAEVGMREKAISAAAAQLQPGHELQQPFGDPSQMVDINAYSVGTTYTDQVLAAHQALSRAGYPAHIVHERLVERGVLTRYKTLVIVGQTFDLPPAVRAAIDSFVARGGRLLVDSTTTVKLPAAVLAGVDLREAFLRWAIPFSGKAAQLPKQAGYFQTNYFMDELVRRAAPPMREAMRKTASRPAFVSETVDLAGERHVGGEGALYMILNGHEELPTLAENQKYAVYNYAPYRARYRLLGIPRKSAVYLIEGADWKQVTRLDDAGGEQTRNFDAGEMKLYLVAPRAPSGLAASARASAGSVVVRARLKNLKMPWPITVTLYDARGQERFRVQRATDGTGVYEETFPLGMNAAPGTYRVEVASPVSALSADARFQVNRSTVVTSAFDPVRVFDREAIEHLLSQRSPITIAIASEGQRPPAERLAAALARSGIPVTVRPEHEVWQKVSYPRVWNPYATVWSPSPSEAGPSPKAEAPKIEAERTIETDDVGQVVVRTTTGAAQPGEWRKSRTLLTVVGKGYVDWSGNEEVVYQPGCKLYVDEHGTVAVLHGRSSRERTTPEFRARWSRPWSRLTSNVGAFQLPPELPEAFHVDAHLILLGDGREGTLVSALQASELLPQIVDEKYPGPGRALVSFAWSPFAVDKNVILIGAADAQGLDAGVAALEQMALRPTGP
jgi:hypothetical protein